MKSENSAIKKITVKASGEYDVIIGGGILESAGEYVKEVIKPCAVAVITDDTVEKLYFDVVEKSLIKSGYAVKKFVFPHGEQSKNLDTFGQIQNFLAQNALTRTDAIIALGGGVVGDMAGFAAATYLRGIKYVQIPTTLLAQIDSSVGGKTAVDLPAGKNLVGAFKQPSLVLCDTSALSTLPKEIFTDGMGETAKYAVLDKKIYDLLSADDYRLDQLVALCVDYKRKIVEADEYESGVRKLLNLGHTPAHGIEKLSGYTISHGRAVAMGLVIILKASLNKGYINGTVYSGILSVIKKCVPTEVCPYALEDVCEAAAFDKKRNGDFISVVMAFGVGDCRAVKIKVSELKEFLS